MREGAVTAAVVDFHIPDNRGQEDDGRVGKKIADFINPCFIEVQERHVGAFVGVRDVVHEACVDGIAAVRAAGVVEVDDAEFRLDLVFVQMPDKVIIGNARQVVEFVVVDEHRESFLDMLSDVVVQHGVTLARTGRSENERRTKRVDDVDPSLTPPSPVNIAGREVHRIFVGKVSLFLKETFVFIVERVVHEFLFHQAPQPHAGR